MTTFTTLYTTVMNRLKAIEPTASFNVTQYVLSLGAADAVTGQYAKSFAAGVTIEMLLFSKTTQNIFYGTGYYMRSDIEGFTQTAVSVGDKIRQVRSAVNYDYIVTSVEPQPIGDAVAFYIVGLVYVGDYVNG